MDVIKDQEKKCEKWELPITLAILLENIFFLCAQLIN